MKTIEDSVIEAINSINKIADQKVTSNNDRARAVALAKIVNEAVDKAIQQYVADIRAQEDFNEELPDLGLKVVRQAGSAMTEIKNDVLDELTLAETKQIVKVSEKSLKEIGHEDLIAKYKATTGTKSASVQVKPLKVVKK